MPPCSSHSDHPFATGASITALTLALLAGCASPSVPRVDEAKVRQFAGQGYHGDRQYAVTTTFHSWDIDNRAVDLTLTLPVGASGRVPLIVYLPGLGEGRNGGGAWRTAWAENGYAVLSVQPLPEDARAWSSPQARAGDFALLARERYSGRAMGNRLTVLAAVLEGLIRRQEKGEAAFERIDLSRVGIAGFDVGAYAAMVAAGERIRETTAANLPLPVRAVVALSPFADFSGPSFGDRYAGIGLPVLSVTGEHDTDALGVVTSAAVRRAPFEYMPPGGKFLLNLTGVTHATLAGRSGQVRPTGEHADIEDELAVLEQGNRKRGRKETASDSITAIERQSAPTVQALGAAAIRSVSTAFFDAHLKNDTVAGDWLRRDASRWLAGRGELKRK